MLGVGVLSPERLRCDTGKVTPHRKRLCILHAEHSRRAPPQKKTGRFRHVLGWCLCQDTPYDTIILTTISFCAYNNNYNLWIFLTFYIWTPESYCISTKACFEFLVFLILLLFFHEFCMLYIAWLCLFHPCNLSLLIFFLITNYPIRFVFCQVINYNWVMTIKSEKKLASDQLEINQYYLKIRNKWQDIYSNLI